MKFFISIMFTIGTIAMQGIASSLIPPVQKVREKHAVVQGILFGIGAMVGCSILYI